MQILVAEPDRDLQEILAYMLRRAGYETLLVHDGARALTVWQQQRPGLVLLETALPGQSGWSVCQTIRETDQTPLIFLSTAASRSEVVRGLQLGADDYVRKPFDPQELLARIGTVLRRAQAGQEQPPVQAAAPAGRRPGVDPSWGPLQRDTHTSTLLGVAPVPA
jgi:DNA-binding response OmpR family regulator